MLALCLIPKDSTIYNHSAKWDLYRGETGTRPSKHSDTYGSECCRSTLIFLVVGRNQDRRHRGLCHLGRPSRRATSSSFRQRKPHRRYLGSFLAQRPEGKKRAGVNLQTRTQKTAACWPDTAAQQMSSCKELLGMRYCQICCTGAEGSSSRSQRRLPRSRLEVATPLVLHRHNGTSKRRKLQLQFDPGDYYGGRSFRQIQSQPLSTMNARQ
jgi:hypothetical protein